MWLEHLQLRAFRAFADADIELSRAGLVLIIGANNSGKSTLLGAIDALRGIMPDQPISNTASSDPARLIATFVVDDELRDRLLADATAGHKDGDSLRRVRV